MLVLAPGGRLASESLTVKDNARDMSTIYFPPQFECMLPKKTIQNFFESRIKTFLYDALIVNN